MKNFLQKSTKRAIMHHSDPSITLKLETTLPSANVGCTIRQIFFVYNNYNNYIINNKSDKNKI
jgi:hypothetical protein